MKTYLTRELTSAEANSTVIIRRAGDTKTPGEFGYITILSDSAHLLTFYDGETSAGVRIAIKPASVAAGTYWFRRPVSNGLAVVVAASYAGNCIVGYN